MSDAINQFSDSSICNYTEVPGTQKSDLFSVTVNKRDPVFVAKYEYLSYVKFALLTPGQSVQVDITTIIAAIENVALFPKRLGILPTINKEAGTVSFVLDKSLTDCPRQFILKVNESFLAIFIDLPETNVPRLTDASVKSILDFGIDNSGSTLQTVGIQQAVAWMAENTENKTILYFPPGVYLSGTIEIRKTLSVYLHEGARIQGSSELHDYSGALIKVNGGETESFAINGRGMIDGCGTPIFRKHKHQGVHLLQVNDCAKVSISDIILRDSVCWTCHTKDCTDVTVNNVKVINPSDHSGTWDGNHFWNDSFDLTGCTRYINTNCFAWSNDDCIAVMTDQRKSESITFTNLLGHTNASGIRIGWNSGADIERMIFNNCEFVQTPYNAISIHELKNGGRYGAVEFTDCSFDGETNVGWRDEKLNGYVFFKVYDPDFADGAVRIDSMLFKNCIIENKGHSLFIGDPQSPIKSVMFHNVNIAGKHVAHLSDIPLLTKSSINTFSVI